MNARNSTLFARHDLMSFRSMRERKKKKRKQGEKHRRELRRLSVPCALCIPTQKKNSRPKPIFLIINRS
jgi:hypothetical protein